MTKKVSVVVRQSEEQEAVVERPVLAQAILSIDESMKKLSRSGISKRGLALLVQDNAKARGPKYRAVKPSIGDVTAVIESLETLKQNYLR